MKTKTNPLHLTKAEHKRMTMKVKSVKQRKKGDTKKVDKKYATRDSPPYPANECCGMTKIGNDGRKYVSKPKVNGICAWSKKTNR